MYEDYDIRWKHDSTLQLLVRRELFSLFQALSHDRISGPGTSGIC